MSELSYPIGEFVANPNISDAQRQELINSLEQLPARMRAAITGLSPEQLETPYRPDGWTVRQTVHHTADSHMNGYTRFKLGLTEEVPTVKPYDEKQWANLEDGSKADLELSLRLLEALHQRWAICLRALPAGVFTRQLRHPDVGMMTLDTVLQNYEWHGRHHVAHITRLRERMSW